MSDEPSSASRAYASTLFDLAGRTALVTGAAGHLGSAMAAALAEAGAHVVINGRRSEPLRALESELERRGHSVSCAIGDAQLPETADAIAQTLSEAGKLDVLINNSYAGGAGDMQSAEDLYAKAYSSVIGASVRLTRRLMPLLEASHSASIINIASMYGMVSPDPSIYAPGAGNPPFYGAAKAALLQWTRYAAVHLAAKGVRVNAISPGPFPAPSVGAQDPDFVAKLAAKTPLKRIGRAEEIKGAVLFLASGASTYVTGANIVVDGGWTAW